MTRREQVEQAANQWTKQLTDVSGRNRLLHYRDLKVGTLDLSDAMTLPLKRLLEGKPGCKVRLSQLFNFTGGDIHRSDGPLSDATVRARNALKRARAVSRKGVENFEERGVHTLYLAQGFATWTPKPQRPQPAAPVLMCAAGLHRTGVSEADFDLSLDGEWSVNEALLHYLSREFNITVSGEELLGSKLSDARLDKDEVEEIYGDLLHRVDRVPGFAIDPNRLVLGNFLYKKMPMVNDIMGNLDGLTKHDLIAAIAGDEDARESLRLEHSKEIDPSRPDSLPPSDEYLVLDADSTQNQAINAALAGESFVLQGPPGTGKSQTISNLISTMMARGKSVLFVAEKRAAIDAVSKRLNKAGLEDFVMDLHGGTVRRRELARQLDQSLNAISNTPPASHRDLHQSIEQTRSELSGYAKALHRERRPWGLSFFQVQERLLKIKDQKAESRLPKFQGVGRAAFRITPRVLNRLSGVRMRLLRSDLIKWAELSAPFLSDPSSPWAKARVTTKGDVLGAHDLTLELVPAVSDTSSQCLGMVRELGLPDPGRLIDWICLLNLLSDVKNAGERPDPEPLNRELHRLSLDLNVLNTEHQQAEQIVTDLAGQIAEEETADSTRKASDDLAMKELEAELQEAVHLANQMAPAAKGGVRLAMARMFSSSYKAARREVAMLPDTSLDLADSELLRLAEGASDKTRHSLEDLKEQSALRDDEALQRANHLNGLLAQAVEREKELNRGREALEEAKRRALNQWEKVNGEARVWDMEKADRERRWKEAGGRGAARLPSDLAMVESSVGALLKNLDDLLAVLPGHGMEHLTLAALAERTAALEGSLHLLNRLPEVADLEENITGAGVGKLLQRARRFSIAPEDLAMELEEAWLTAIHRHVLVNDSLLGGFDSARQNRLVTDFRQGDRVHLRHSSDRVRRRVAEHAVRICNTYRDQNDLVRREAAKKTRHLPLRMLFEKAPEVLTAVRPCWAMSPLDVAQTMPARPLFDVVVFDEASQVLPSDAICALFRGRRAVVAGDARQLPPTVFFDGAGGSSEEGEYEEDTGSLADYESILDVMGTMLSRRSISWHYRSQDERLIAFSNRNIYHGSLTTFPGADADRVLSFELVDQLPGHAINTRRSPEEVKRVVELMIQHARERPQESLGVIAMGRYHADRIEQRLRQRLGEENSQALEQFFREEAEERAFVKNLERVQGDERDAIILSIGYGKNANGHLVYRFGPLNMAGGERRLNVAITRARRRMTVVSSFSHADMEPNRSSAEGVRKLRSYLRYVESGGSELGESDEGGSLNPFEMDVMDKLRAAGLEVVPQYGCSGYRIDFAVQHPTQSGQFLLAVEADGASYHSSHTARDRDRLRQEHLERLGWRFCRIWSTNWFNDHQREVGRVLEAYRHALSDAKSVRTRRANDEILNIPAVPTATPAVRKRGPQPTFEARLPIYEYDPLLLVSLARWVMSDGCLRTDDQIFEEIFQQLGYRRRGPRIKDALYRAIEQAKASPMSTIRPGEMD